MRKKMIQAALWVTCCAAAVSCQEAPAEQQQQQMAQEYAVLTVSTADKEVSNAYSATIRGRQDIEIYAQVSGTISQLNVTEGQVVSKGQTLFVIDQVPYKAALKTAQANVEAAKAGVATAKLTYDSKKELMDKNVVSAFDFQTAANNLLTAQAQLAQAEAQEVNAANNLSYTVVKSPSNGVVGVLPYRVGALVGPSSPQPLTTVSDNSEMYVYFSVPENQLLSMTREYGSMQSALAAMPKIQLQLNDGSMYPEAGTIESVSGVIDRSTGSVTLRAVFPNPGRLLHSGASGNVIIPDVREDCIVIPKSITFEVQDKIYVYKIVDGLAKSTMIQVAKNNDAQTYIVEAGLTPGETLVAEGVGLMREGTPVKAKAGKEE